MKSRINKIMRIPRNCIRVSISCSLRLHSIKKADIKWLPRRRSYLLSIPRNPSHRWDPRVGVIWSKSNSDRICFHFSHCLGLAKWYSPVNILVLIVVGLWLRFILQCWPKNLQMKLKSHWHNIKYFYLWREAFILYLVL